MAISPCSYFVFSPRGGKRLLSNTIDLNKHSIMKAVIVEDQLIIADHLQGILEKNKVQVLAIADNLEGAEATLVLGADFYLLDIRLSERESGIAWGKRLQMLGIPFFYITANNEPAVLKQAIATNPQGYISKPFNENDIIAAIELLRIKIKSEPLLEVIGTKGVRQIPENQILYCEADGVYSRIFMREEVIMQRITLKELEEKLSDVFLRVHRSYLVNKKHITSKKAQSVFVGDREIPVSRTYR